VSGGFKDLVSGVKREYGKEINSMCRSENSVLFLAKKGPNNVSGNELLKRMSSSQKEMLRKNGKLIHQQQQQNEEEKDFDER